MTRAEKSDDKRHVTRHGSYAFVPLVKRDDLMAFWEIWLQALILVVILGTFLWGVSVRIKMPVLLIFSGDQALWSVLGGTPGSVNSTPWRSTLLLGMVTIWGLRLPALAGVTKVRERLSLPAISSGFGPERYWWFSYFQVFLLQGDCLVHLGSITGSPVSCCRRKSFGLFDAFALLCWGVGFAFEAGGDWQLAQFKANPANKGKVLDQGFGSTRVIQLLWRCCGLVGLDFQCGQWELLANDWSSVDDWADHSGFRSSIAGTHPGGRQAGVSGLR